MSDETVPSVAPFQEWSEEDADPPEEVTHVQFLTGPAGSGKTFTLKQRMADEHDYGVLAATTGVAAVNLDTVTVNSLLGYFDTESLKDSYTTGWLHRKLIRIREEYGGWLWIDEISMMHAPQLDLIYNAVNELNHTWRDEGKPTLSLGLTGDFCQLAPVKGKWAFKADCWEKFAANVTRLTKIWRQADLGFLEAVNYARAGCGSESATKLKALGAQFAVGLDLNFNGTTIVAKNDVADRFNAQRLLSLPGKPVALTSARWGKQKPEWKNIPLALTLKEGALAMILTNQPEFDYVNGDLATVLEIGADAVVVRTQRTGMDYSIPRITRQVTQKDEPRDNEPHEWDEDRKRWVMGAVTYFPLRLGYASTVHKSQGLSLDRVQIDCRDGFFGSPNMAYVALSRARTVDGLRIVGQPDTLARRIKLDPAVKDWL